MRNWNGRTHVVDVIEGGLRIIWNGVLAMFNLQRDSSGATYPRNRARPNAVLGSRVRSETLIVDALPCGCSPFGIGQRKCQTPFRESVRYTELRKECPPSVFH